MYLQLLWILLEVICGICYLLGINFGRLWIQGFIDPCRVRKLPGVDVCISAMTCRRSTCDGKSIIHPRNLWVRGSNLTGGHNQLSCPCSADTALKSYLTYHDDMPLFDKLESLWNTAWRRGIDRDSTSLTWQVDQLYLCGRHVSSLLPAEWWEHATPTPSLVSLQVSLATKVQLDSSRGSWWDYQKRAGETIVPYNSISPTISLAPFWDSGPQVLVKLLIILRWLLSLATAKSPLRAKSMHLM